MSTVTAVEAEWLAEMGPMFFSVKENYAQRMLKRKDVDSRKKMMEARRRMMKPSQWKGPSACFRLASRRRRAIVGRALTLA